MAEAMGETPAFPYRISVDTGGTFTDVVVTGAGRRAIGKALTTPERIFSGIREAIGVAADELGLGEAALLAQTEILIYGTTRATNAIVTGNVSRTAFLTTEGFPDTLVLRAGGRSNPHDYGHDYPRPYIPRRHTFEIRERIRADGSVSIPFDEAGARAVVETLRARQFEAVAVCFLWSIANPDHELRVGRLIEEIMPGTPFTLSHQLAPIVREYRRASATAIDASLKPLMQRHFRELEEDLRAVGYANEILVSTTVGGSMLIEELARAPIYAAKSGPAMAPVAGAAYSRSEGLGDNVIVCDSGGTTFDVGLVRDGRPTHSRDTWLGGQWTGHLLGISSVDIRSLGAGGGSIAWIDGGGLLRIGPQSAGADPGPACYGRGGRQPTVSDAATVLGYFDPDYFLGGRMRLDVAAARGVIGALAGQLGRSLEDTAYSVVSLASELMIKAIQEITIAEGVNPRESTIVAGGGAAGLNILPIARELGCRRIILPKTASALSASGMQFADIIKEETASLVTTSAAFDLEGVNRLLEALDRKLRRFLAAFKGTVESTVEFFAEARYVGQVWELETPLPFARFDGKASVAALVEAFHAMHERVFAVRDVGSAVECVNWTARLTVRRGLVPESAGAVPERPPPVPSGRRACYFGDGRAVATPVFRGEDLAAGDRVAGPAIIEEPTTTLVAYPGTAARVSSLGHYILDIGSAGPP